MSIDVFVVSWAGQHVNAAVIARQLGAYRRNTTIVYSDPEPLVEINVNCKKTNRPNDLYWTDKFLACLNASGADTMLIIHADCSCDNWEGLVDRCVEAYGKHPHIGVWAPLVRVADFEVERTRIARITGTTLSVVAHTDAIVFAIPRTIIDRMRIADYTGNIYGWGIGWMMNVSAYCRSMIAVVDESVVVRHPQRRGYSSEAARIQMVEFLRQLSPPERIQFMLLRTHMGMSRGI